MSRTLTATETVVSDMYRRDANGDLVKVTPQSDEYVKPGAGRYRLELSGISETFPLESTFRPGEQVEKCRVEFTVVKGKNLDGRRFTQLFTWTVGPKSNLGKLLGALRGQPIHGGDQVDPDTFIGTRFIASLSVNEAGYAEVAPGTIEGDSIQLPVTATGGTAATPVPINGAAASNDVDAVELGNDPFADEEL